MNAAIKVIRHQVYELNVFFLCGQEWGETIVSQQTNSLERISFASHVIQYIKLFKIELQMHFTLA